MKKMFKLAASVGTIIAGVATAVYLVRDRFDREYLDGEFEEDFDEEFEELEKSKANASPAGQPAIKGFRETKRD